MRLRRIIDLHLEVKRLGIRAILTNLGYLRCRTRVMTTTHFLNVITGVVDVDDALVARNLRLRAPSSALIAVEFVTGVLPRMARVLLHLRRLLWRHGNVSIDRCTVVRIHSVLWDHEEIARVATRSTTVRLEGLVLRVTQLADNLASILLGDTLPLPVHSDFTACWRSTFLHPDKVGIFLDKS